MSNINSPWLLLGAAIAGFVSAASIFLIEHMRQNKRRHAIDNEIYTLRRELEALRVTPREKKNSSVSSTRRRHPKSNSSILTTTTEDYRSAIDLDSSDSEFYDCSDDENTESRIDIELRNLDLKLEDETSPEINFILERLQELSEKYPRNTEISWRLGKAHKILCTQEPDIEKKKEILLKAIDVLEKAIEMNPKSAECHKWFAIIIGMRSDFQPIKERLVDGHTFKKHLDIALTIRPQDPLLHHLLGRFAYEIAQLSWFEKSAAQMLFGEVPSLTHQDALGYFTAAEDLSSKDWKANRLYLAKCLIAVGQTDNAVNWLKKAKTANSVEEDKIHDEVKNLLQKYER